MTSTTRPLRARGWRMHRPNSSTCTLRPSLGFGRSAYQLGKFCHFWLSTSIQDIKQSYNANSAMVRSHKKAAAVLDRTAAALETLQSRADLVVRHQFDATIVGATIGRVVGGDEVGLPVAVRNQLARRDAGPRQVIDHRIRTPI